MKHVPYTSDTCCHCDITSFDCVQHVACIIYLPFLACSIVDIQFDIVNLVYD